MASSPCKGDFRRRVISSSVTFQVATNNNPPVLNLQPPPITSGPITKPITGPVGGGGTVAAVPLPAAAPAGLAMLGLFGIVYIVRRIRTMV